MRTRRLDMPITLRRNRLDSLIGKRVNRLTIMSDDGFRYKDGSIGYRCECVCGVIKTMSSHNIRKGKIKSCGCLLKEKVIENNKKRILPKGESGFRKIYRTYKISAKKRYLDFSLSEDEFGKIIFKNCYYCGHSPSNKINVYGNSDKVCHNTKEHSNLLYSGIDRVDSSIGYEFNNCVPSCKICNFAKSDMNVTQFKNWIQRLIKYNEG